MIFGYFLFRVAPGYLFRNGKTYVPFEGEVAFDAPNGVTYIWSQKLNEWISPTGTKWSEDRLK